MRVLGIIFALLVVTLLPPQAICQSASSQAGEQSPALGWLEGTILTNDGHVLSNLAYSPGSKHLHGVRHGGSEFDVQTDNQMGGLYGARNLRPGIYDITVEEGYVGQTVYAPQRIFGIVVKPGVRTVLNIVMNQGEQVKEIGSPVVATTAAVPISVELAQLHQQISGLKQQIEALKKQTSDLQTQLSTMAAKSLK